MFAYLEDVSFPAILFFFFRSSLCASIVQHRQSNKIQHTQNTTTLPVRLDCPAIFLYVTAISVSVTLVCFKHSHCEVMFQAIAVIELYRLPSHSVAIYTLCGYLECGPHFACLLTAHAASLVVARR